MPLDLDNSLPTIPLQFKTSDADKIIFFTHADSCAAMNVGNLELHQWIIATKPEIIHSYIQFDGKHKFDPIILNCALGLDSNATFSEDLDVKLTAIVTYNTRYVDDNDNSVHLSFGLAEMLQ